MFWAIIHHILGVGRWRIILGIAQFSLRLHSQAANSIHYAFAPREPKSQHSFGSQKPQLLLVRVPVITKPSKAAEDRTGTRRHGDEPLCKRRTTAKSLKTRSVDGDGDRRLRIGRLNRGERLLCGTVRLECNQVQRHRSYETVLLLMPANLPKRPNSCVFDTTQEEDP